MKQVTIQLTLEPQVEGGYTVASPVLPGLVTEGESVRESLEHAWDVLLSQLDAYQELGRPSPLDLPSNPTRDVVRFEYLIAA